MDNDRHKQRQKKLKQQVDERIAKRHYFDNSQLCFFAAYQGIGCNHF
ncbi:hypothetical protein [Symbiopectobacterium purcellii]